MKTIFKSTSNLVASLTALAVISLIFSSCKKSSPEPDPIIKLINKVSVTPDMPQPGGNGGLGTPIVQGSDGVFRAAYGGLDLNFGTNVFWPTTVLTSENGTPFDGISEIFDTYNTVLSYTVVNGRFALVASSMGNVGNISAALHTFNTQFGQYVRRDVVDNVIIQPNMPTMTAMGNFNPVIISGQFILDSASPTHLSISPIKLTNTASVE